MNPKFSLGLGLVAAVVSFATTAVGSTVFQDDFTTLDTTSVWTISKTAGAVNPAVSSDTASFTVTSPNNSQRTFITTQNSTINPFDEALTISLQGLAAGGTMLAPSGGSRAFFALVGMADSDTIANYYPTASLASSSLFQTSGALGLLVKLGSSGSYVLEVVDYGASISRASFSLTGIPTDITFNIDGAAKTWSATLVGSAFAGGGTTQSGTFSNYSEGSVSRLSIGAIDMEGTTGSFSTSSTVFSLDGITVTSTIPEPSHAAMIMGGVVMLPLLGRRLARRAGPVSE